jgi:ATP-dependent helicase HrpA
MIQEGERQGCLEDTLVLAAALSIQDPRERPLEAQQAADEAHARFKDEHSDFASLLALWAFLRKERHARNSSQFRKLCRRQFLAWQRVLEWFDLYQQLRDLARENRMPLKGQHGDVESLHKALLSGLLSHIGQRHPEDRSYLGARNRNFHIFPGSGLFGASPKWLMAAEIVETSKPYARTCARIEPAWIEQQGAHLLKRTHFDPHWSRRRGKVLAWEQVSLFGLIIVEKRRVDYSEIDPREARRLFIIEALVRGELDSRAPFLEANRRARAAIERLEHKRRQRDVLVDEQALAEFFDARIPAQVVTAKAFSRWLSGLDTAGLEQLYLGEDVLLREDAGAAPETLFPDHWVAGGKRFELAYRFDPGHPADGVSLVIPLELLNVLRPAQLSWQVPGLRRDLVVELMRTLPKPLRRALTPLPQFALAAIEALSEPAGRSLTQALAEVLEEIAGVRLQATDFQP